MSADSSVDKFLSDDDLIEQSFHFAGDAEEQFDLMAWQGRLEELAKSDTDVKWQLGDWLLKGEPHYYKEPTEHDYQYAIAGEAFYSYAESVTGLAANTLRDLASTARRVPVSVRTDACTWSHHRVLVNTLPDADETTLREKLKQAVDQHLSVSRFKKSLSGVGVGKKPTLKKSFVVTVPLDVWETLKDFADEEQSTVQQIAAQLLISHDAEEEVVRLREMARKNTRERRHKQRQKVGRRVARSYNPLRLEQ